MEGLVIICLLVLIAVPVIILVQIAEIKKLFKEWINYQKRQSRKKLEQQWSSPPPADPQPTENDAFLRETLSSLNTDPATDSASTDPGSTSPENISEPPEIDTEAAAKTDAPGEPEEWMELDDQESVEEPSSSEESAEAAEPVVSGDSEKLQNAGPKVSRLKPLPARRPEYKPSAFEVATRETLQKIKNWILVGEENAPDKGSMENALASQWLMRIGILLLFAGAAYLMKYSIDNDLISPLQRVYAGLFSGLALVFASHKIKEGPFTLLRYGLMGVGVGILYIASLAATALYQLIPNTLGYVAIGAVSTLAGLLSYRHQSLFLALVGILGAYTTPLVIGIQGGSETSSQYYAYLFFISAGALFVCSRRDWPLLILTSFLLHWSQVIVLLTKVQDAQWTQALSFTIAYCIGYSTITFARHLRLGTTTTFIDMLILVLNAVAFTISVSYLVPLRHEPFYIPFYISLATGGASVFYAMHAWFCWKTRRLDYPIFQLFCLLSGLFALITIPNLISTAWMTSTWTLAGLALLILASKNRNALLGRVGFSLLLLGVIRFFLIDLSEWYFADSWRIPDSSGAEYFMSFLKRAVGVALPTSSMIYATLLFLHQNPIPEFGESDSPQHLGTGFFSILRILALSVFGGIMLLEVFFKLSLITGDLLTWTLGATLLLLVAHVGNWVLFGGQSDSFKRLFDYTCAGLGASILIYMTLGTDGPSYWWMNITILTIPLGMLAAIPLLSPERIKPYLFLGVTSFITIYLATTEEAYHWLEFVYPGMEDGGKTIVMILNAIGLLILGLKKQLSTLRIAGLLLIGISILKMYFFDLKSLENIYRVLSLVAIGLLLIVGSTLYLKAQSAMAVNQPPKEKAEE
ncbi:MAG: DUF2339 domain-containing protein [Planctomycetia bacterium]|nr:DUF2339 domain-containing protein [Planctomycetia bacterium]